MKKGEIIEVSIDDIKFPNKGVSTYNGKKVVIKGGLPGQNLIFTLKTTIRHQNYRFYVRCIREHINTLHFFNLIPAVQEKWQIFF